MICSFSAAAEIALIETSAQEASECKASATVRATGTAGPFTVLVYPAWGADSLRYDDVSGDIAIPGLCDKPYNIVIYATAYPQCAKNFYVDFTPTIGTKNNLVTDETMVSNLKQGELLVQATPNPASTPVTVTVFSLPLAESVAGDNFSVSLLSESGKVMERRTVARTGSKSTFPLETQRFKPGVYLIRVVSASGKEEGIGKLVII